MTSWHLEPNQTLHTARKPQANEATAAHAQEATQWAKDIADVMGRTKRELLVSLGHVIHTPIQGVIGTTKLLLETELAAEQRQYAETVWQTADALLTLLSTTLNISDIEAGECDLAKFNVELRTPLQGVIGMTRLLLATELTAEQRQYAEIVRQAADALLTLLRTILGFTEMQDVDRYSILWDFDLRTVIEHVVDLLTAPAHDKGLELSLLIHPALPTIVRGDPAPLRLLLLILVGSAVSNTDHGEVVVHAYPAQETDDTVLAYFEVRDTRIGVTPEGRVQLWQELSRFDHAIAQRFRLLQYLSQADGSIEDDWLLLQTCLQTNSLLTRKYGATEFELAIAKEQVTALLCGTLGTESTPSQGCKFWFTARLAKP